MSYSPTLSGRRLGSALRRLRDEARLSAFEVANRLGWSASKISRIELAHMSVSPGDVRELLATYNVDGQQVDELVALAREARQPPWWRQYREVLPGWFEPYLGLEGEASRIYIFELGTVPDLLQTEDYTTAVLEARPQPLTPDEQAMMVSLWDTRQNRLIGDTAVELDVIIAEGALRQRVGGTAVMRAQLDHLSAVAALPNVVIRVLPFEAGAHPTMGSGGFSVLEFPSPEDSRIAYTTQLTGGFYLDLLRDVGTYRLAYEQLRAAALGPEDSAELIARLAAELTSP